MFRKPFESLGPRSVEQSKGVLRHVRIFGRSGNHRREDTADSREVVSLEAKGKTVPGNFLWSNKLFVVLVLVLPQLQVSLDGEADVNTRGGEQGNALQAESEDGQEKAVTMLLSSRRLTVNTAQGLLLGLCF